MKKVMLVLCLLATINFVFAQKIKIDKKTNIVSVDDTDAVKISETKSNNSEKQFVFTSLDGADSMTFSEVMDEIGNHYFEVETSFSDKKSEIDYEDITFSLNDKVIISNLIIKKYGFLTTSGINKQALNDFLEIPFESKKERLAKAKARQAEAKARREALITKYNPVIEKDSIVINKQNGQELGKILLMPGAKKSDQNPAYYFTDTEGNIIANLVYYSFSINYPVPTYFINTYQGKEIILKPEQSVKDTRNSAINELAAQGFWGTEENAYSVWAPERRQWLEETSPDNTARTDVQGVLITKKGETISDGSFRLKFRQTPDGMVREEGGTWLDMDGSKSITHFYQDDKGKDKTKVYKSKDIQSFIVNRADGIEEIYESVVYEYTPSVVDNGSLDVAKLGKSLLKKGKEKKELLAYKNVSGSPVTLYKLDGNYYLKKAGEVSVSKMDLDNITNEMITLLSGHLEYQNNVMNNREKELDERLRLFIEDYNKCLK